MKYLPLREIDIVNNAINFSTSDLHIIGNCDIYTTKNAGDDKRLYRQIEENLESRHEALVRLSASLSPPYSATGDQSQSTANGARQQHRSRTVEPPEIDLSRDSPFGSLSKMSSRRTFAYLIATLNAAHPDYDFSHVLRTKDFKKEVSLTKLKNKIDTTVCALRPKQNLAAQFLALPNSHSSLVAAANDIWSERMWEHIDKEMKLNKCERYSYNPTDDPFDEEGAIWSMHYFFFNKELKRVCYFHVRALSVISHSPLASHLKPKRKSSNISRSESAGKRASYWLGDKASNEIEYDAAEDEMEGDYSGSSDDEDVDRVRYTDLDQIRNNISAGYWGMDGATDYMPHGPGSVTDEIGDSMEI